MITRGAIKKIKIGLTKNISLVVMLNPKKTHVENSSWCVLSIDNVMITAKIQHMGRGKYKILATKDGGDKYINYVVDASDVFSCKRE